MRENRKLVLLSMVVLCVFVWSAIRARDSFTWFLEVLPVIVGMPILVFTCGRFRLTELAYLLIAIHAVILMIGGHYTYAEMPLFNWIRDTFHQTRNNYDKLGHFAQGFVPAILAREILLRQTRLQRGKMLFFLVVCVCLALSACYELFEWRVAVATGTASDAFLGTQGDPWDTQEDMAWALAGAIVSLLVLARIHDRCLSRIVVTNPDS